MDGPLVLTFAVTRATYIPVEWIATDEWADEWEGRRTCMDLAWLEDPGASNTRADSSESALVFVFMRSVENGAKHLLGGHLFLFAFHAHLLQFALLGFDGCRDLLLHLGGGLFELG